MVHLPLRELNSGGQKSDFTLLAIGVIYLSMVVRRVAIRFRLSYYGQGDPGYSAAAYPEDPCEPAPALASRARLDTLTPWLKVPKTHTRARRQLASC